MAHRRALYKTVSCKTNTHVSSVEKANEHVRFFTDRVYPLEVVQLMHPRDLVPIRPPKDSTGRLHVPGRKHITS